MPRISLWKPDKGNDYKLIDRVVKEHLYAGGTGVFVHKYLGPHVNTDSISHDQPKNSTVGPANIQDLLFLENRDRKYDTDVYDLRGSYSLNDQDFDLTQFGLFQTSDVIYITFHLNSMVESLGRKIMPGDVFELPHLRDDLRLEAAMITLSNKPTKKFRKGETITGGTSGTVGTVIEYNHNAKTLRITTDGLFSINENITGETSTATETVSSFTPSQNLAINKFYVVEDTARGQEGYDPGWWPHVWRCKATAMQDTQEFRDILGSGENADDLKNIISTYQSEININDAVINEAERHVPTKGVDVGHLYVSKEDMHKVNPKAQDGTPGKTISIAHTGNSFPSSLQEGDYVLRTDYHPSRLFRKEGSRFIKISDNLRGLYTSSNKGLDSFINNTSSSSVTDDGQEKQNLSKVIPPKAD